jgi:hypothetical protein
MADVIRRIGLSLGADLCWPICYEEILRKWNPAIPVGDDLVRFEVKRVTIEPFDLKKPCPYDLVLDRLTHWYHISREWIKKAIVMDGLYVLNNPWSIQAMEKQTTYCAMMHLGFPIPDTWMVPPKEYEALPDLQQTLERYAEMFDLGDVGRELGYPMFMKPYDGGAWVGVSRIGNEQELKDAYDRSGKRIMHLQKSIEPFDLFVRCLGVGPQIRFMRYSPDSPLHERYQLDRDFLTSDEESLLRDMTLTINTFFGWDFNSCEVIRKDGVHYPIDFANACPDSQVTSLHYHFPWLVEAKLRWSLFCAASRRPMRRTLDWEPYYRVRERNLPFREALAEYAEIARERFDVDRFDEFCHRHLRDLDEVSWEFFGTETAKRAVRLKVEALFPAHEHEQFTEHFWERIQMWRRDTSAGRS